MNFVLQRVKELMKQEAVVLNVDFRLTLSGI
jgi:hypothetical protein